MPTSVRHLKSLFKILPLEASALPCVAAVVYVRLPFFLQRRRNRRELSGRDLMKLMILMLQFKTSCSWGLVLKCNKPFYGAVHRSSSIGAYAATTCSVQTFLREESIYHVKNTFSGGSPLHTFAQQYMLSNAISIAVSHKTHQLCTSTYVS